MPVHYKLNNKLKSPRLLAVPVNVGGFKYGYTETISCNKQAITPNECHKMGAKSS